MEKNELKVVISGSPGSGRSALAKALGEKLGLPVIPEAMINLLQAEQKFRATRAASGKEQKPIVAAKKAWVQSFIDWANQRAKLYQANPGFVADKWEADLLALWLANFGTQALDEVTVKLLDDMRLKARMIDLVVMMPMKNPRKSGANGDAAKKTPGSFTSAFMGSVLTAALVRECPNTRVLMLQKKMTIEQQVDAVETALSEIKDKAASSEAVKDPAGS